MHPGAGNWTGTLVNALIHHCGDSLSGIGGVRRPGIVHRIDKDTSGLLVVAKTDAGPSGPCGPVCRPRQDGALERAYAARLGRPSGLKGTIDANLAAIPEQPAENRGRQNQRPSCRHPLAGQGAFRPAGEPALASLLECRLETGRTHQIRVHMAHIGHPLIGDDRLWLRLQDQGGTGLPGPAQGSDTRPSPGRRCMLVCWLSSTPSAVKPCALSSPGGYPADFARTFGPDYKNFRMDLRVS